MYAMYVHCKRWQPMASLVELEILNKKAPPPNKCYFRHYKYIV